MTKKEPDTEPTKTSKTDTKTPSEDDIQKAIEEDSTIFDLVETSENLTNTLLIAVSNTESGTTTTLDVYDLSGQTERSQYHLSSQLPKKDGTNDEYVEAAKIIS